MSFPFICNVWRFPDVAYDKEIIIQEQKTVFLNQIYCQIKTRIWEILVQSMILPWHFSNLRLQCKCNQLYVNIPFQCSDHDTRENNLKKDNLATAATYLFRNEPRKIYCGSFIAFQMAVFANSLIFIHIYSFHILRNIFQHIQTLKSLTI